MAKMRPFVFAVQWSNPYTSPPPGQPRVLIEVRTMAESGSKIPPEVQAVSDSVGFGKGWCLTCGALPQQGRQLSPEAKGSVRRKRLARAAEDAVPLFAAEVVEREITKNPGYYRGDAFEWKGPQKGGGDT